MQRQLSLWMLISFLLAIPFATYLPEYAIKSKFLGDYFIYLLKQFVPFLIFGTITYSIASFGSTNSLAKIVPLTLSLYLITTLIAIAYALIVGSQIQFGTGEIIQLTASPIDRNSIDLTSTLSVLALDFKNFFSFRNIVHRFLVLVYTIKIII